MNFRSFVGQLLPPGMMEIFFIIAAIVMVIYLLSGIRVVKEWERAPVFRFGRYIGLKGPGIIWICQGLIKSPVSFLSLITVLNADGRWIMLLFLSLRQKLRLSVQTVIFMVLVTRIRTVRSVSNVYKLEP